MSKFRFLTNYWTFRRNVAAKISNFGQNFEFRPYIIFLRNISIFGQKFKLLAKMSIGFIKTKTLCHTKSVC